ncbi:MAG: glycoside hydrolase family 97 protein [Capsulimonas sp.]
MNTSLPELFTFTRQTSTMKKNILCLSLVLISSMAKAAEMRVISPDGKITFIVSDDAGLRYRVQVDGKLAVVNSRLGLQFKNAELGANTLIVSTQKQQHKGSWEDNFGKRRVVSDRWNQVRFALREKETNREFGLIVRAYNDGVAFRYDLPIASGLGNFVLTKELTEFCFADDDRSWLGNESSCAECQYPETKLSKIPMTTTDQWRRGQPYWGVLPLVAQTPTCTVAVAESDLLDWGGMFLSGTGGKGVTASLASRADGNGLVVSSAPSQSPWRVLMIGRKSADLLNSNLVAALATPNELGDVSWVKPGVSSWDPWWTGVNSHLPQYTGLDARGDTDSDKEYIDLAAKMGWSYQLVDWRWYQDDLTQPLPHINIPELVSYANNKGVRLFLWMHSNDVKRDGFDKVFSKAASWGFAGVKVDFMNSDSQETVQWYVAALKAAAKYKLMVDFHGAYKPTGLSRTYPNLITQEGVLGNEYNKLGYLCTPEHTVTLPFTRGLLGPMDFTPGGFLNRSTADFKVTFPAVVMGTRARQLAMTVIYQSPLLVMCDSPANYSNQPGVEFLRELPTTWDETVILGGEIGQYVAIARRSGHRWYLTAMNGDAMSHITVPLNFLGKGKWNLHSFSDSLEANAPATAISEVTTP